MRFRNILYVMLFLNPALIGLVKVGRFKIFEITMNVYSSGNLFKEVKSSARFIKDNDTVSLPGFYDDEGAYKIRFIIRDQKLKWNTVKSNTKFPNLLF